MNQSDKSRERVAERYVIGRKVVASCDLAEAAGEDAPGGILAFKGECLVVRKHGDEFFSLYVSHEHVTDRSFGIMPDEIRMSQD